ncbi:MAG: aspartate carbamoyltransferase regulatory subunit, partial [Bacteroidales bacterium]|nr:aspartate carbamoyltransferase regulatory subunit [Bacteroidales bacterium]
MNKKERLVAAIKNGTVIDHIPAKDLFKVIRILGLDRIDTPVTFGNNLDSQKFGKKAIIKVSDKFFEDKEINKIALIAP